MIIMSRQYCLKWGKLQDNLSPTDFHDFEWEWECNQRLFVSEFKDLQGPRAPWAPITPCLSSSLEATTKMHGCIVYTAQPIVLTPNSFKFLEAGTISGSLNCLNSQYTTCGLLPSRHAVRCVADQKNYQDYIRVKNYEMKSINFLCESE